jgi:hypothetical protein
VASMSDGFRMCMGHLTGPREARFKAEALLSNIAYGGGGCLKSASPGIPAHGGDGMMASGTFRSKSTRQPSMSVGGPRKRGAETPRSLGHDSTTRMGPHPLVRRGCRGLFSVPEGQSANWHPFDNSCGGTAVVSRGDIPHPAPLKVAPCVYGAPNMRPEQSKCTLEVLRGPTGTQV